MASDGEALVVIRGGPIDTAKALEHRSVSRVARRGIVVLHVPAATARLRHSVDVGAGVGAL